MNTQSLEVVWTGDLWRRYHQPLPAPPVTRDDVPILNRKRPARPEGHADRGRPTRTDQRVMEALQQWVIPLTIRQLVALRAGGRCGCQGSVERLIERGMVQAVGKIGKAVTYGLVPR